MFLKWNQTSERGRRENLIASSFLNVIVEVFKLSEHKNAMFNGHITDKRIALVRQEGFIQYLISFSILNATKEGK